MYQFHISLHARPSAVENGPMVALAGEDYQSLAISPALSATAMLSSFEEAGERLSALPQMYFEPDGSLVWTSKSEEPKWQVDGVLYDRGRHLLYVDLKGTCPAERFDALLAALRWPEQKLIFQLTREAVFLDEQEFRRFANRSIH